MMYDIYRAMYIYMYIFIHMAVTHRLLRRESATIILHTNFRFDQLRMYACMHTPHRAKQGMLEAKRQGS